MIVVSDTSAITNLFQVQRLDLLRHLYGEVIIPPGVREELYRIEGQREGLGPLGWLITRKPTDERLVTNLNRELDYGESQAIALAVELRADYLIIDEYKGRQRAEEMGVRIVGLLGILIAAKKHGHVQFVSPILKRARANGFRLSDRLVQLVLARLGEV